MDGHEEPLTPLTSSKGHYHSHILGQSSCAERMERNKVGSIGDMV